MRLFLVAGLFLAGCGVAPPPQKTAEAPAAEPARAPVAAPAPKPAPPPAVAPTPKDAPTPKAPSTPKDAPTPKPAPAPKEAPTPKPAAPPKAAPAPATAPPPKAATLDLKSLEQRLKDTNAVGVLTKLSLKNQVDDLVARFRAFHTGQRPPTLAELRPSFDLLLMKVLSLLQDKDAALAKDIDASRNAIWEVLADRDKLAKFS